MKSLKVLLIALTCMSYIAADLVFLNADAPKTCPKYSCDTTLAAGTCAKAAGKFADGSRTVGVNKCADPKVCPFVPNEFQGDADKSTTCADPTTPPATSNLPGEACKADADCKNVNWWDATDAPQTTGKCTNNVCQGSAKGKRCDNFDSCTIGFTCAADPDPAKRKCVEQSAAGGACASTFDCQNNQFCNNKVCTDAFSLAVGASVKDVDVSGRSLACSTGYFDATATDPVCLEIRYTVPDGKAVSGGLLKCDVGSKCNYGTFNSSDAAAKAVSTSLQQDCTCPYSGDGVAYCPYSLNAADNTLGNIASFKKILNNKNHTLKRRSGDPTSNDVKCQGVSGSILFKGAPQCVIDAAGYTGCSSAFKVALSFITIAIMFILF